MTVKRSALWISFAVLSISVACSRETASPKSAGTSAAALTRVELRQEWFPFSGFTGEVVAARRFAAAEGLDLRVVPGSEAVDPIKLVLSGSADFAVASADLVIEAVAKGAPLVVVGVVNERTPTCFLVRASSTIRSPADFPGHTVGVLPGTNTERVYALMMKRSGVDRSKVREIAVPFDLNTFLLNQYDVRPAFIYDEPVSLEMKGVPYRAILPEDHGVSSFIGTVYFTRRDVLAKQPDIARRLVRVLVAGWQYALAHPDESIDELVRAFPTLDRKRELRSLQLGSRYFAGSRGKPLYATPAEWQGMISALEEVDAIPRGRITVRDVWDPRFVEAVYR